MDVKDLAIPDIKLITLSIYNDERGYFVQTFQKEKYENAGINYTFIQDNISVSKYGVLRGLHYQINHAQGKLISVLQGRVYDVVVDLRKKSDSFGAWLGINLSDKYPQQLWVPPGFAHGFLSLSDNTIFSYKCTDYYDPQSERTLLWNDPSIGIEWNIDGFELEPIVSAKDEKGVPFERLEVFQ